MRFRPFHRAAGIAALTLALSAAYAFASSHSEAPGTALDRYADDTDTYAFVSPDLPSTVTLIGNWVPLEEPAGGPNFYGFDDNVYYYINVDNTGDSHEHIVYEFRFTTITSDAGPAGGPSFLYNKGPITSLTDANLLVRQTYTVKRSDTGYAGPYTTLGSGIPVPPVNIGPKSTPNYEALAAQAVTTLSDGSKVFAGQRDDAFFVDLGGVFDLLTIRKLPGDKGKGVDGVGGFNVMTIAIQVPKTRLTPGGSAVDTTNNIIGVWSGAKRPQTRVLNVDGTSVSSGPLVSVSRLGNPLVNEVVIARKDKDKFNASQPSGDGQFLSYVTDPELAKLLHALYGIDVPAAPRNDLVAVFLTGVAGLTQPRNVTPAEELRLNMLIPPSAKPNRLAVLAGDLAGFPNGRRLADDVTDIELRAVAGVLVPGFNKAPNNQLGDGVDFNDTPYLPSFPYLASPHQGFEHTHHPVQNGRTLGSLVPHAGNPGAGTPIGNGTHVLDRFEGSPGPLLGLLGPNPGRRHDLQFTIAKPAYAKLQIFDLQGRWVRTLVDQPAAAGTFRARWDGRGADGESAGRGIYFARLSLDGSVAESRKLTIE